MPNILSEAPGLLKASLKDFLDLYNEHPEEVEKLPPVDKWGSALSKEEASFFLFRLALSLRNIVEKFPLEREREYLKTADKNYLILLKLSTSFEKVLENDKVPSWVHRHAAGLLSDDIRNQRIIVEDPKILEKYLLHATAYSVVCESGQVPEDAPPLSCFFLYDNNFQRLNPDKRTVAAYQDFLLIKGYLRPPVWDSILKWGKWKLPTPTI